MKIPRVPHSWSLTPPQAITVQKRLASRVLTEGGSETIRFVAGLDAAFSSDSQYCLSAVVLWDRQENQVVEQHTARKKLAFPYIPGLLSFREAPALLAALRKLNQTPDVLVCDGQGLAHPRRFGIACHLGVICHLPAIGCAKSRLMGHHDEPSTSRGARAPLQHHDEVIGSVVRTQTGVQPVYVSIGHRITLPAAEQVILDCAIKYRLPEPTRLADRLVAEAKRALAGLELF